MSQVQTTPEDALAIAQKALNRVNELEETVAEQNKIIQAQDQRIAELEAAQPDNSEYSDLTREEKVGMVRQHLVSRAESQGGKAALDYDDIQWEVFNGEPSADHAYTLMERAATEPGFDYNDPSNGNKRITVDTSRTMTNAGFSHANKDSSEGGN